MSTEVDPLSTLIQRRMAELGMTYTDVAKAAAAKGHEVSRASVYAIANNYKRHHVPHTRTLKAIAAGLNYPFDVIAQAATQSAGYRIQDVTTTLQKAGTLRVIAAVHEDLSDDEAAELAQMAERYAAEVKARRDQAPS